MTSSRNLFIESVLREVDENTQDDLAIYYEDLTDQGKAKVLDAIDASDDLIDIFGDPKSKEAVEDSLYGKNGKTKVALAYMTGTSVRSELDI